MVTRNPLSQLSRQQNITPDSISPAQRVWQALNPSGDPLIHIRIESPTILVLGDRTDVAPEDQAADADKPSPRPRASRYWNRTDRKSVV